jgi:hypothetical protein
MKSGKVTFLLLFVFCVPSVNCGNFKFSIEITKIKFSLDAGVQTLKGLSHEIDFDNVDENRQM